MRAGRGDDSFHGKTTTRSVGQNHRTTFDLVGVEKTREEAMTYMHRLNVFECASKENVKVVPVKAPMSMDWVDVNREMKRRSVWPRLGHKMQHPRSQRRPPMEALRFKFSRAVTEVEEERGREVVIMLPDISFAHLHSPVLREAFVRACGEDTECPPSHCWKLLKAMYRVDGRKRSV